MGAVLLIAVTLALPRLSAEPAELTVRQFGVSPPGWDRLVQRERDLPVVGQADVVVAGGGVAGVAAALRAADEGLSVLLLESRNRLGRELTATYQCRAVAQAPPDSSPLARAIYADLVEAGVASRSRLDPIRLGPYLHERVVRCPRIKTYLFALPSGVVCRGRQVCGVVFTGRSGRQIVLAKVVVDATADARVAAAAGASFLRGMAGEKTARRFIAASRPKSLPLGRLSVAADIGLDGNAITVHDGFLELCVKTRVGSDIARDLSMLHALTLERSFSLRRYFEQSGMILGGFAPAPESWIDEMPVVACREQWTDQDLLADDFSRRNAVLPVGVEGLVIAGRTTDRRPDLENLQALLGVGETAGSVAAEIAEGMAVGPTVPQSLVAVRDEPGTAQVREILDGIEGGESTPRIRQAAAELPVRGKYDVLVVGGGTSGSLAAIAAARQGARVAVVEILPNLGGISSNRVHGYYWGAPWKSLLRQELGDRIQLEKSGGAGPLEKVRFSGEDKKHALQNLALAAGVDVFYQSLGAGATVEGNRVTGVIVDNAAGRQVLLADVVIDATGHGGIAMAAGASFTKGRGTDGFVHEIEHGPLRDPTHLGDISTSYLKAPSSAVSLNIRESRRILGDYVVTFDDVLHERMFCDTVCRWRSNYDTHFPNSANQSDRAQDWTAILGLWRRPIVGSIPYRSLLPRGIEGILVSAMAYSCDHDALVGGRMQPDLEHLGEAAGVAAAMACQLGIPPRQVPAERLQDELVRLGVLRSDDVAGRTVAGGPSLEVLHRQDFWREEREQQFPPSAGPTPSLEQAIGRLGTPEALDAMVQLYLAGEEAAPPLRSLLKSPNLPAREEAAILLGLAGDRAAVPALMGFLKNRNQRRFRYTLPEASSRPSVPLYWSAAILLGRFGERTAVPLMLDLLGSASPNAYGSFRREAYGDDMFRTTDECPPPLASFLIVALGRIGDPKAAPAVRPFLDVQAEVGIREENRDFEVAWAVRTNAAWALARMGDDSGIAALAELQRSDQSLLRAYAGRLLDELRKQDEAANDSTNR
jgi:NADPH-dependent 2,4-dienoyl-CoA reductase/sulfur reductase-like enzyme